jgi:precorrin-6B methylase 2
LSQLPYLSGPTRATFDAWAGATWTRYVPPLTFTEVRKGVQALERVYDARDVSPKEAARATEGHGKRAALATYLAQIRFLTAWHAAEMLDLVETPPRRIVDVACGTGATGAALARACGGRVSVIGIDRSGWALEEARETWQHFAIEGRAQRGEVPEAMPRADAADLIAVGWVLGELPPSSRAGLLRQVDAACRRGAGLLVLEPLVRPHGWWLEWSDRLRAHGVREEAIRVAIDRPELVRRMDKAARQDHQVVAARALGLPPRRGGDGA